ncbi:hypothetical protein [Actinomadura sp. GTD37]|uniref:hypothetical protein n=1 Tax=Actinomadura sp. GTD37 TaxID=1778030 RepID=UPI0035BFBD05
MNDHPDLRALPAPPSTAHEKLLAAKAQAIQWATFIAFMAAIPAIVWLWRWAV